MLFGVVVWGWWLQDGCVLVVWWACLSVAGGVGWCLVSWSGGSGVVGAWVWGRPVGSLEYAPEAWQRVVWAWQGWLGRHEGLARGLFRLSVVCQRVTIALVVVALVVVPRLAVALVPVVWMLACLGVVVVLARTRTVSWRLVSVMFSLGVPWALVVAKATEAVAAAGGMTTSDHGVSVALAAFVEEPGKLVPLVVVALVAPGRVRRLAAVDWALLGYAAGAGFTVAEDASRRLAPEGLVSWLLGGQGLGYSLNPWTAGSFRLWSDSPLGWLAGEEGASPLGVGHHVSTMTVAMALGLGIVAWRTRNLLGRVVAWVLPGAVLVQVVVDHAAYNASVTSLASVSWLTDGGDGIPGWVGWLWQVSGRGGSLVVYSMVLFGLCQLTDARRRLRTGPVGTTAVEAPRVPALAAMGGPAFIRAPLEAAVALVAYSYSDLVVIARGYGDRRMTRPQRMIEGRLTAAQVMAARRDAMAATTPGTEPRARRTFAAATLTVCLAVGLLCLWYGTLIAQDIGSSLLTGDTDPAFFAGLLDELAEAWNNLEFWQQLVVMAALAMVLMTTGLGLGTALVMVDLMTWAMAHGHGLASYLNNPAAAKASYLRNLTLGQALTDGLDLAMTFIPLGAAGAGSVARTTARTMATNRTLMKEGAKEATQATEHTAARTQAQHVTESQAAHSNARQGARRHEPPADTKPDAEPVNERADRGDGRDVRGRYTDGNSGAHMYDESEAIGLEKYTQRLKRRGETVREVIEDKRLAHIDGAPQGRYYDRLIQREDGTWVGLEVKSGDSSYAGGQRAADSMVSPDNPARVTLDDGRTIEVTEVYVQKVEKQ